MRTETSLADLLFTLLKPGNLRQTQWRVNKVPGTCGDAADEVKETKVSKQNDLEEMESSIRDWRAAAGRQISPWMIHSGGWMDGRRLVSMTNYSNFFI